MSETVKLVYAKDIAPNPENPRLIFRADELEALEDSIRNQGILVPLTLYKEGSGYRLLDGERRWRCAIKLGLKKVPVIIQPKPDRLTNLMMMFAIHHRRNEWDPLPTALKLRALEDLWEKRRGRKPTERALAELASLTIGEVRRYKKLLALPKRYIDELLKELEKPRSQQSITVDHVLESSAAASALVKRSILDPKREDEFRRALIAKFKSKVIENTVAPRKLAKLARAVQRGELKVEIARKIVVRLIEDPNYGIDEAFNSSVQRLDFEHTTEQAATRLLTYLDTLRAQGGDIKPGLRRVLEDLASKLRVLLSK